MLIRNTADWKMYMEAAFERGWPLAMLVQTHEKPQAAADEENEVSRSAQREGDQAEEEEEEEEERSQETHVIQTEPQGQADEGERISSIVEQMQIEDEEAEQIEEPGDSSDEEGEQVPAEWSEQGLGNYMIHDARGPEWEYRENEVVQGSKYPTIDAVKEAVKLWSVSLRKKFRVVKSKSSVYEVKCLKEDCPWRVHAFRGRWKTHWECSVVIEHACYLEGVEKSHRNLTVAFIANEMYGLIIDNLSYEPKMIIRHIERTFKYTISYAKAWRAKQKVFEMRFGTYEASYDNLPCMLCKIIERNPGSYWDVLHFPSLIGGPSVLQRVFFCLGPCVKAFQYCLPLLCIDGTFMIGKYKGQILTAIEVDGNNQVVPVAFAFVENENTGSWYWFLERVKDHVVGARPDVCLISDRHSGILEAIRQLQQGHGTEHPKWADVRNRWCMRHMGANFYNHFKNKDLMVLFKRLCAQNQQHKFNTLWKLLDDMIAKQIAEREARASSANTIQATQSSASGPKPFTQWIRDAPKEKWSLIYDTDGRRYGIMTTNQAESYNMVMRGVRCLSLVGIVEFIMYGCTKYFRDLYHAVSPTVNNPAIVFGNRITEYMHEPITKAHRRHVRPMGTREQRFEVACKDRSRRGVRRERVLQECLLREDSTAACTCHKPKLLHLPCSHVIAACVESGVQPRSFVSPYFTKEAVASTWEHELYGIGVFGMFTQENTQVWYIPDPETKRTGPGRRQTRRIRNGMDESEAGKVPKRCTQCNNYGHNYKKCPMNEEHDAAEAGPSGNASDGRPPVFQTSTTSRARPRR